MSIEVNKINLLIFEKRDVTHVKIAPSWYVEIMQSPYRDSTEFWLSNNNYAIKTLMFSIPTEKIDTVEELKNNIIEVSKPYIKLYKEEVFDYEDLH